MLFLIMLRFVSAAVLPLNLPRAPFLFGFVSMSVGVDFAMTSTSTSTVSTLLMNPLGNFLWLSRR